MLHPNARRYSPSLLSMSILWQQTSSAAYRQVSNEDVLTLPSQRHLRRLTSALDVNLEITDSTIAYLRARRQKLSTKDLKVTVIMDEVFCQKNVQYSNGKFFGLENDKASKTLLCVMIKSVAGRYRDVVCMTPIVDINAEILSRVWHACHTRESISALISTIGVMHTTSRYRPATDFIITHNKVLLALSFSKPKNLPLEYCTFFWQKTSSIITVTFKSFVDSFCLLARKYAIVESVISKFTSRAEVRRRRCLCEGKVNTSSFETWRYAAEDVCCHSIDMESNDGEYLLAFGCNIANSSYSARNDIFLFPSNRSFFSTDATFFMTSSSVFTRVTFLCHYCNILQTVAQDVSWWWLVEMILL